MKKLQEWAGVAGLLVALVTLAGVGAMLGRRDAKLDELDRAKVDHSAYQAGLTDLERRLGVIEGDVRVIRTLLEERRR